LAFLAKTVAAPPEPNRPYNRLMWIWQRPNWPHFTYEVTRLTDVFADYRQRAEQLAGRIARLPLDHQEEALVDLLVSEAIRTSAIEGEQLDRASVRSSIMAHIGLAPRASVSRDPRADGIAALMVSVRQHFGIPMDDALIGTWQTMVIPDVPSHAVARGGYRIGRAPMLIVSG
jgi:hypothetical protein